MPARFSASCLVLLRLRNASFALLLVVCPCTAFAADNTGPPADPNATSTAAILPDAPSASQMTQEGFVTRLGTAAKTIGSDELYFMKWPFQVKALKYDALFLGATAVLIANDESVLYQVPQSWHSTSITLSDAALGADAGIAGGIFLTGLITGDPHAQETGIRTGEAAIDSVILYSAAKAVFARQRPYTGVGEGKFFSGNWSNGSFPSGHSMFTWTIASTVAHEYHPLWLKLVVYGLATTVSTARVTGGQHYPADVFVGGVLGYGVGAYVANRPRYNAIHGHPYSEGKMKRMEDAVLEHVAIQ